MSGSLITAPRRPIRVFVDGVELATRQSVEVGRDLADICGQFRVEFDDAGRDEAAGFAASTGATIIREHQSVEIRVLDQTVLRGSVEDLALRISNDGASGTFAGRDVVGDLVDCTANPTGPAEYRQIGLVDVVSALATPFGLTVDADTDLGAPFTLVALDIEPAMATIGKLSRQRGVLVVSDGVGGVRLTKAGTQRSAGSLTFPGNVLSIDANISVREHFSDVWVKGSFRSALRPQTATLSADSAPSESVLSATPGQSFSTQEAAAVVRYGHAVDPNVGRWRPRVWAAATQSGGSAMTQNAGNPALDSDAAGYLRSQGLNPDAYHATGATRSKKRQATKPRTDGTPWTLQDQALWRMRTTRAHGTARVYTVAGHSMGGALWTPNTLVPVSDAYSDIHRDMLIGAVTFVDNAEGYFTRISVVDPATYDLEGDVQRGSR
ncbi:phage baseplate assembly protein [Acetobacter sp. DsW_063]|uniref:phage baseplate assembly protein n=1 Tax=Acetobacter sp. DsW_063 TaxID=1514894 RepID=UPI000A36632F|nr:hypothetical protein [Acetobacter sp. DsW_063]OUJ14210.1 hypothetical protein HK28_00595 [Acetobacter sp. DsW_063]